MSLVTFFVNFVLLLFWVDEAMKLLLIESETLTLILFVFLGSSEDSTRCLFAPADFGLLESFLLAGDGVLWGDNRVYKLITQDKH